MISRIKITLLTGAAALATAALGTGMAAEHSAQPPMPIPSASSSTAPGSPGMSPWPGHWHRHGHRHGRGCMHGMHGGMMGHGMMGRIEHGEGTVQTARGPEVVDIQRGTVESVGAGKLTVRSADGFSATYTVNHSTTIRKGGKPSGIARVMTKDQVIVLATKSGTTATATRIVDTGHATTNR
jgi:hypothetical protein